MKDYKRLTRRINFDSERSRVFPVPSSNMVEVINRLAELEDKIESGTLIELPCKKGDDVFAIVNTTAYDNSIITGTVEGLAYIILDEYGDITFQHISRVSPIKAKAKF